MHSKFRLLLLFFLGVSIAAFSQQGKSIVKGKLLNESTNSPATDVQLTIPYLKLMSTTDAEGVFTFSQVPFGTYILYISNAGFNADSFKIIVAKDHIDLGNFLAKPNENTISQQNMHLPTITLESSDVNNDDDGISTKQSVSGVLNSGKDPFINAASFVFSNFWFKPRGYERAQQQVQINGAPMNDVETNDASWSQWGGLNDVFRGRSSTYGLQPSEYAFGGINGNIYFDASAGSQRKQTKVTYTATNRQYKNRVMITQSSGMNEKGWATSFSFSRRWAQEGYVAGTFYDSYAYYAAVTKKVNNKHELNLIAFGSPTRRGKTAPTYSEAFALTGNHFYNSDWGYQNGEKRNAKVANSNQPVIILSHEFTPNERTHLTTTASYQFGKYAVSSLDWYNAADPRPDYYKYLPSYYLLTTDPNAAAASEMQNAFVANPQIKWDDMYQANYMNLLAKPNADGSLSNDIARRSMYYLGNDVDDIKKFTFNTNLQHVVNDHVTLHSGISFISQKTESYRQMLDLLGGDYIVNVNGFTERNALGNMVANQNDLNHPNQIIKEGDKYLYDYNVFFTKAWWWGQATFTYNKVDFFLSTTYGVNSFQREGLMRNGIFSEGNQSFGKSDKQSFSIYGFKGGITYKINGRNYLFLNLGTTADAPTVDQTYFSARTRNQTIDNPTTKKSYSLETGYLIRSPKLNGRFVGYVTDMKDMVEVQRFFDQSTGNSNTMVDYVMQHMNARFIGTELAIDYKINTSLSATVVAALGQAFYTNNPKVTVYKENTLDTIPTNVNTYIKNYYLGVGPQSVYTLGLNYRSKKYWYANMNFNMVDRNYIDIAAPRRTMEAVGLSEPNSAQWNELLHQQKFDQQFTVDLTVGKSFLMNKTIKHGIPKNTFIYLNMGVSNLLDNTNVIAGGFENARFDYANGFVNKFAPKYSYAFGRTYFLNVSLKF